MSLAVGKVTELAQQWESRFKELARLMKVSEEKKPIDKFSLDRLNKALNKKEEWSKAEFEDLEKVINLRNYVNHTFFLENEQTRKSAKELTDFFTDVATLICEATDLIDNKIENIQKGENFIKRPTIIGTGLSV